MEDLIGHGQKIFFLTVKRSKTVSFMIAFFAHSPKEEKLV